MGTTRLFVYLTPLLLATLTLLVLALWLLATGLSARRWSPARAVFGGLCLMPALLVLVAAVCQIGPYGLMPTRLMLWELRACGSAPAWHELDRRRAGGRLSAAARDQWIEFGSRQQTAARPVRYFEDMLRDLGDCAIRGGMSNAQLDAFCAHLVVVEPRVRQKIVAGEPVRCVVGFGGYVPPNLFGNATFSGIRVDGVPQRGNAGSGVTLEGGYGGPGVGATLCQTAECTALGRHELEQDISVALSQPASGHLEPGQPVHTCVLTFRDSFEVLPDVPANHVQLRPDPALAARLHDAFVPRNLWLGDGSPRGIGGMIEATAPVPVNVAFEVFLRSDGHEYAVGTTHAVAGQAMGWGLSGPVDAPALTSCDVILRSSAKVAAETTDLFEIWDGELVYTNVPMRLSPSAAAALQAAAATQATQPAAPTPGGAAPSLPLPPP